MPSPEAVRAGLDALGNGAAGVAVAWHAALLVVVVALLFGWSPSRRSAGLLLAAPLLSVGVVALVWRNPFNAAVFLVLAGVQALTATGLPATPLRLGSRWAQGSGILLIALGWAYPHFLQSFSALTYLYAAPTGVIPCPTLALAVGVTLAANGLGSRRWSLVLAGAAAFYAVVGALWLRVAIDLVLLAGAVALCAQALAAARPAGGASPAAARR
jgi:hypothetical protein